MNMQLDLSRIDTRSIAVVGGVSEDKGMELYMQFDRSINSSKFKEYLMELRL